MKSSQVVLMLIGMAMAALAPAVRGQSPSNPQDAPAGWKLTWSDEFNGHSIDRSKWGFETGNGESGWGNNELEYYTDRPANAFVENGMLHIRVLKESYHGFNYTSARMLTRGHFSQKYGRFDFRAKLPVGMGLWPALWMLPEDDAYGGWPLSGEIDITEARGEQPDQVLGTIHFGQAWPKNQHSGATYVLPEEPSGAGGTVSDFHLYTLEWEPGVIRWYVDGVLYSTKRRWWSQSESGGRNPWPAPFDRPFFLIMNVAVGGNFLHNPDQNTHFPKEMVVDYVRAYEKIGGYGPTPPEGTASGGSPGAVSPQVGSIVPQAGPRVAVR